MTSSVGNTALLNIAGSASNAGSTAVLSIVVTQPTIGVGNTAVLTVAGQVSASPVGQGASLSINPSIGYPDNRQAIVDIKNYPCLYATDPTGTGVTSGWYADVFNDSSWSPLLTARTLEFQGITGVQGWVWFRLYINLPASPQHADLTINLASLTDDTTYWNGNLIGGSRGAYQYTNVQSTVLFVPSAMTRVGLNTMAIRTWCGPIPSTTFGNGLIDGPWNIQMDSRHAKVRPAGGNIASQQLVELYDFSSAQQSTPFELVLTLDPSLVTSSNIAFSILDYYGNVLKNGASTVSGNLDGTASIIISVDSSTSQQIYFAGRFKVNWQFITIDTAWAATGNQLAVAVLNTTVLLNVYQKSFSAGTVSLPPSWVGPGMYMTFVPDPTVVISALTVNDIPNASFWSLQSNMQVGSIAYGDRTYPLSGVGPYGGSQYIQTAGASLNSAANPLVSFNINKATTVDIAVDLRNSLLPWETPEWVDTGTALIFTETPTAITGTMKIYARTFSAGTVALAASGASSYITIIPDLAVNISALTVYDPDSQGPVNGWSINSNLQVGNLAFGNRGYLISTLPGSYAGAQYIQMSNNTKAVTTDPTASFSIDRTTTIYMAVSGPLPWIRNLSFDHLNFAARDNLVLPALSTQFDSTPYGSLKLIDTIDCSTPIASETHPYLQSAFSNLSAGRTPGFPTTSTVTNILGKNARSIASNSFFCYRIGAGTLTVGKTYLLRVEYPEDVPRYLAMEIMSGTDYYETGFRGGIAPGDAYDPWPLSGQWQFFDCIFVLGQTTTNSGGPTSGDATKGVMVMFLNEVRPLLKWTLYTDGPAIATMRLYEIDPIANAPVINKPAGMPQRVMTLDLEHQTMQPAADYVNYAKLMGYNTVSPLTGMKWGTDNWAEPLAGYNVAGVDTRDYWGSRRYVLGSGIAPPQFISGVPSQHVKFIDATKAMGIDYIPRFEYGGSYDLPLAAKAIGADGNIAVPNRYGTFGTNLLHSATYDEMKVYLDTFVQPFMSSNPQFKGVLWRQRRDSMQISFGANDATQFSTETSTALPGGFGSYTPAQVGAWCLSQYPAYENWWHGKRAAFHQQLVNLLQTYRAGLELYYYNWDNDKWGLLSPDWNSGAAAVGITQLGGPTWYANDRAKRAAATPADYLSVLNLGNFAGSIIHSSGLPQSRPDDPNWADYAIRPSLYASMTGIQIFCPTQHLWNAIPEIFNYFQTADGLAVSNVPSYDEASYKFPHTKYETTEVTAGGAPFSMAMELLAVFYGDARTLTFTGYTIGRGFADAHRRFAQAFQALPAIPGTLVSATSNPDVAVRTYPNGTSKYVSVAHKGYTAQTLNLNIPGSWPTFVSITNLVTGTMTVANGGSSVAMSISSGPMQLNSFLVAPSSAPPGGAIPGATSPTYIVAPGDVGYNLTVTVVATNAAGSSLPATSSGDGPIIDVIPTINTAASIPGTPKVGSPITAIDAVWNYSVVSLAYQWQANGVNGPGAGATTLTYTPAANDLDKALTITVTATNTGGTSAPSTSAPSAAVTATSNTSDVLKIDLQIAISSLPIVA